MKIIRLTEGDITKLIKKIINENVSDETNLLNNKREELSKLEDEYGEVFYNMKNLKNEIEELENRISPKIYFTTAKHHTTKEPYIIARSMFKKGLNDYVQLSSYIGPVSKFADGIDDEEVKKIALDKIRLQIKKKVPLNN